MNIHFISRQNMYRLRVLTWLAFRNKDALIFRNDNTLKLVNCKLVRCSEECLDTPPGNIDDAVIWALKKAKDFCSINAVSGKRETLSGKMRSAYDLWRHLKYYRPEITIFDVMSALVATQEKTYSHYCHTVRRRVFELDKYAAGHHRFTKDEFGLYFIDWYFI